jgi:hypothetical protein
MAGKGALEAREEVDLLVRLHPARLDAANRARMQE